MTWKSKSAVSGVPFLKASTQSLKAATQFDSPCPCVFTLRLGPCAPLRVGVDLQCGTSTARLHWELQAGVESYTATANCSDHGEIIECVSHTGVCQFSGLHCGERYQFSVVANSSTCQSDVSSTVEIQTGGSSPGFTTCLLVSWLVC